MRAIGGRGVIVWWSQFARGESLEGQDDVFTYGGSSIKADFGRHLCIAVTHPVPNSKPESNTFKLTFKTMTSNESGPSRVLFNESTRHDVYPFIDPTKPELSVKNKVVLVTGGGRGIGINIVESFAKAQAKTIILTGRSESSLLSTKASLEKTYPETTFIPSTVDIASPESVDNL
ncbi:1867_t:CDS:2, partial [Acaulospora colombiana]